MLESSVNGLKANANGRETGTDRLHIDTAHASAAHAGAEATAVANEPIFVDDAADAGIPFRGPEPLQRPVRMNFTVRLGWSEGIIDNVVWGSWCHEVR